ncbi:MAG: hypothetical protein NC176_08935 [Treponema brennaborense]|nr:hypothetical protein [Treponema brennaborense]
MGASKRIMEMFLARRLLELPVSAARFANVAFSRRRKNAALCFFYLKTEAPLHLVFIFAIFFCCNY